MPEVALGEVNLEELGAAAEEGPGNEGVAPPLTDDAGCCIPFNLDSAGLLTT